MIVVRPFEPGDASALAAVIDEMHAFYGVEIEPDRDMVAEIGAGAGRVDVIVALDGASLVGFATFALLFPVEKLRPFLHVHQVFVGAAGRRLGVASRLMVDIARTARARGCQRLEWTTSPDNAAARALYDGLGAVATPKVLYALDGAAFDRLAAS